MQFGNLQYFVWVYHVLPCFVSNPDVETSSCSWFFDAVSWAAAPGHHSGRWQEADGTAETERQLWWGSLAGPSRTAAWPKASFWKMRPITCHLLVFFSGFMAHLFVIFGYCLLPFTSDIVFFGMGQPSGTSTLWRHNDAQSCCCFHGISIPGRCHGSCWQFVPYGNQRGYSGCSTRWMSKWRISSCSCLPDGSLALECLAC